MIYFILRTFFSIHAIIALAFNTRESLATLILIDPCDTQQASNADFKKFWDGQWWNLQAYYQQDENVIDRFAKTSAMSCLQVQLTKSSEDENMAKLRIRNDRSENGTVTSELNLTSDGDKQLLIQMTPGNLILAHVFSSLNNGSEYFCIATCDTGPKQNILKQIRCYGNTEESKNEITKSVTKTEVTRTPTKC